VGIHASQKEVPQQGMSTASRKSEEHSGHFRSSGISIADRLRPMCVPALVGKQLCSVTIALNLFLPIGRQWSRLRKQNSRAASLSGVSDYKRVYSGGARSRLVLCADGRAQTRGDWRCGASAKADNALVGDHHNLNDASTRRHERSSASSTRRRAHFLEGRFWDALRVLALHDVIRCVAIRRAIPRNVTCRQAMRNGRNHLLVPR
jgi:hypothetical protein